MPISANEVAALRQFVGQGEIYTNVEKPASNTAMAFYSVGVPKLSGSAAAANHVGLTSGPATLEYKPDFKGVEIEQAYGEVAPRVTKEAVTLKFKCAEATYNRLQTAIQTATLDGSLHNGQIANPVAGPTLTAVNDITNMTAGTVYVAYSYLGAIGETLISPVSSQVIILGDHVHVAALTLPAGVTQVKWYVSQTVNSTTKKYYATNNGAAFNIVAYGSGALIPSVNTTAVDLNTLFIGGLTFFDTNCVALVSKIGSYHDVGSNTDVDLFEWLCLYEALSVDGLKLDWKRGETRMVEVAITGYADVTRDEGDQLFQLGQQSDPN